MVRIVLRVEKLTVEAQLKVARSSVLVVRARDRAALVVKGKDRISWLNGLLTCDVARLSVGGAGGASFGFFCEKKGKILCDLQVIVLAERVVLLVPAGQAEALLETLDHFLIMEDVELSLGDDVAFRVHGPQTDPVLAALGGHRLDLTGLGGGILLGKDEDDAFVEALADALHREGGALGGGAGEEVLRVLAGVPRFGVDFDTSNYPQETSLEKVAVSFGKGCYLGQEVIYMLQNRGHVKRLLVRLDAGGGDALSPGDAVMDEAGRDLGRVTSAAASSGESAAIAMVKRASSQPGTTLMVAGRSVKVAPLPAALVAS